MKTAKPISEILKEVMPKTGPRGGKTQQRLWKAWKEVVGDKKAEHTRISSLKRGSLHIEVESPAMLQELTGMNKREIVTTMKEKLGEIFLTDIRLKLAKD